MRRLCLVGVVIAVLAARAEALTIRDVVELSRAGVGEEVLLALIEVDRGVYAIDTATLKQLKAAGVSERVIVALVRSGREIPQPVVAEAPLEQPEQPEPQVVVIDHHNEGAERVREVAVPVAVPVYVPVVTRRHRGYPYSPYADGLSYDASNFVPFQSGPPASQSIRREKTEPVYWGWGGKLRPDAWQPSPADVKRHDRRR